MLLIGSRALAHWFPNARRPKDWDLIATLNEVRAWSQSRNDITLLVPVHETKCRAKLRDGTSLEFEIVKERSSAMLLDYLYAAELHQPVSFAPVRAIPVRPGHLWMIKRSHAYWPVHWRKTMEDLAFLRDNHVPETDSVSREFYARRLKENEAKFGARAKANLAMNNDAFFAKSQKKLGRVIEHDRLHEIVAYGERPLYEKFKTDLSRAALDRNLFESASLRDRQRLVREEAMAIALERYVIPRDVEAKEAYSKALQRICTNLTSGWFREFAIDHWSEFNEPDVDYVGLFRKAMADG